MKIKSKLSGKSLQIDKTQQKIIGIIVGATVTTVFCLVSAKVLAGQALYQRRVINARQASVVQLNANIKNANNLVTQYNEVFIGSSTKNIIDHTNDTSPNAVSPDVDNGRIVLDALPTSYDFPALLTSVSTILSSAGISNPSIGGTDDSSTVKSEPSANPTPSKIDLTLSGTGKYDSVAQLIADFQRSIRPMDVTHLTLTGNAENLTVSLNLTTYYQPPKTVIITGKEIK